MSLPRINCLGSARCLQFCGGCVSRGSAVGTVSRGSAVGTRLHSIPACHGAFRLRHVYRRYAAASTPPYLPHSHLQGCWRSTRQLSASRDGAAVVLTNSACLPRYAAWPSAVRRHRPRRIVFCVLPPIPLHTYEQVDGMRGRALPEHFLSRGTSRSRRKQRHSKTRRQQNEELPQGLFRPPLRYSPPFLETPTETQVSFF